MFVLALFSASCNEQIPVPVVPVDFTIDLADPEYRDLAGIGNVITVYGGSRGIMIKRLGFDTFVAFDQHCPYDPDDDNARVSPEAGSVDFAQCATCKTRYNLYFGNVEEGPGHYPLLQYKTSYYPNSNRLRVYN